MTGAITETSNGTAGTMTEEIIITISKAIIITFAHLSEDSRGFRIMPFSDAHDRSGQVTYRFSKQPTNPINNTSHRFVRERDTKDSITISKTGIMARITIVFISFRMPFRFIARILFLLLINE